MRVWDTSTGKQTRLGEPHWSGGHTSWQRCSLKQNRLFIEGLFGPFIGGKILRSELWDLSKMTLIRRLDIKTGTSDVPDPITVRCDEVGVIAPG